MSMKNSSDTSLDRTSDLPIYSDSDLQCSPHHVLHTYSSVPLSQKEFLVRSACQSYTGLVYFPFLKFGAGIFFILAHPVYKM